MKRIATILMLAFFVLAACDNKSDNPHEMIAGTSVKTWKTQTETNAGGKKKRASNEEKKETIQFYANGTFNMVSPTQAASGTWTYTPATRELSMRYSGQNVTENFTIAELDDDNMRLRAADGSEMVLEAD